MGPVTYTGGFLCVWSVPSIPENKYRYPEPIGVLPGTVSFLMYTGVFQCSRHDFVPTDTCDMGKLHYMKLFLPVKFICTTSHIFIPFTGATFPDFPHCQRGLVKYFH